jgi:hypothetical protein
MGDERPKMFAGRLIHTPKAIWVFEPGAMPYQQSTKRMERLSSMEILVRAKVVHRLA